MRGDKLCWLMSNRLCDSAIGGVNKRARKRTLKKINKKILNYLPKRLLEERALSDLNTRIILCQ
ncbi:hypothetical protein EDC56_1757 [Sinobacterium caligoides]|uniref:Uncharacterized protein n=1 Tax=Sinobacterium caligoides TaxID=933926 RepID=A0A3N2DNQ1_9GAMM|nr:hypothetical protein EDC56_1757 [Sinobacterium caligoides]